jgi:hypothetical protein
MRPALLAALGLTVAATAAAAGRKPPVPAPPPADPVTFTARYVVDPIVAPPGGKRLQAVTLLRDDGEAWIRAYQPLPAEYRFIDRKVVVTGRPFWPPPGPDAIGGTHVEVEKIELAPGEAPNPGPFELLPAPPEATTLGGVSARAGLWVCAVGKLESATTLSLTDGRVALVTQTPPAAALVGQEVTVTGRVRPAKDGWTLAGDPAVCAGRVPRCGMEQPRGSQKGP